jgi:hypothetical protein
MSDSRSKVPLTFALGLTLSAMAHGPAIAVHADASSQDSVGMLKALLETKEVIETRGVPRQKLQTAQGCWYGYWRRC